METITSKSNAKIAETKKLLDKKYREKRGLIFVETQKVIKEAILSGLKPKYFFVLENKNYDFLENFKNITYSISMGVLKEISSVVSPDGIVAVFEKQNTRKEYLGGNFLILDCLQNPDNLGAILRTASATNFSQIYLINCVDEYNSKTIRASMGNQFKLKIMHINYDDISQIFKNAKLYSMDPNGKNIFDIEKFESNVGFVIGNEGNGISDNMRNVVENTLKIPMENNVESLNASISASIAMYYIYSKEIKNQ